MTDEERRRRNNEQHRARYRRTHPEDKNKFYPNESNRMLMSEKIYLPLPETETKEQRAVEVSKIANELQKEIRKMWARQREEKSIITVEGCSMVRNGRAIYNVECVLARPYTDELRGWFKSVCEEKTGLYSKK